VYFLSVPARSAGVENGLWRSDAGKLNPAATCLTSSLARKRPIVPSEQSAFSLPTMSSPSNHPFTSNPIQEITPKKQFGKN
jgi:hypothetical protein